MRRSFNIVTANIIFCLVALVSTSVEARGKLPGARALKAPRDSSRSMAKRLRRYGMPMKMVLAPLRIARSHQKMNKLRSPAAAKFQINGVLPVKGTHTMTATKGSVNYAQKISNTARDRSASYKFTGPGGKGKMGVGESISIKQDIVHHRSWKLKADGSRVQTDRLAYPGGGGDVLLQTTTTTTRTNGTIKARTAYHGVSQIGKLGEVLYKLDKKQFTQKRNKLPFVFPGSQK